MDGDAQVSGFVARLPHAKALCRNADVQGAETVTSSCEKQSLHVFFETLL